MEISTFLSNRSLVCFSNGERKNCLPLRRLLYIYIRIHKNFHFAISSNNFNFDIRVSSNFKYFPDTQRNATTLLTLELTGEGEGKIARSGERSADLSAWTRPRNFNASFRFYRWAAYSFCGSREPRLTTHKVVAGDARRFQAVPASGSRARNRVVARYTLLTSVNPTRGTGGARWWWLRPRRRRRLEIETNILRGFRSYDDNN